MSLKPIESDAKIEQTVKRVLVVDDDVVFYTVVSALLKKRGYALTHARSGEEGTNFIARDRFDMVILDGQLGDTTGDRWLSDQRLKGMSLPVAFISGVMWTDADLNHLRDDLKVDLILSKPIVPAAFGDQMDKILKIDRQEDSGSKLPATGSPEFQKLKEDYLSSMPYELGEIERFAGQGWATNSLVAVNTCMQMAHKIRGTAASYGYPELGQAMGLVEDTLNIIAVQRQSNDQADKCWKEVEKAIQFAQSYVETCRGSAAAEDNSESDNQSSAALLSIMVADEDSELVEAIREISRRSFIEIIHAKNSKEAVEKAKLQGKIDAVVIDSRLSALDASFDLPRQLRSLPGSSDLPIAICSDNPGLHNRMAALHSGVSAYILKPVEPDRFIVLMLELIRERERQAPRVLILDDDEDMRVLVKDHLSAQGMKVEVAESGFDIFDRIEAFNPDLLILDIVMPGVTGLDVCRMLRNTDRWRDLPVLFLTAKGTVESRVSAFEAGGDDYLAKQLIREELLTRTRIRIERGRKLRDHIGRDPLSGLPNSFSFCEKVFNVLDQLAEEKAVDPSLKLSGEIYVAVIKLDGVGELLKKHGATTFDTIVAGLGMQIARRFRPAEIRSRFNTDTFLVAFPREPEDMVRGAAESFARELANVEFLDQKGAPLKINVSTDVISLSLIDKKLSALQEMIDEALRVL